ncbi:predicted protein [Nematostella vectensis]|uniref:Beta-hexosaminidase n=1 Tax=Nematostella vectensis TaxID=45351 RepID=A7T3N0_NEMVE|nr:beta-hexosaminidase 1 [Nematostella vectensis]EDO29436.1 predicted protein [Nematostella vectensis]|eukprot:XP_001621536.1 hypothetical protein NEMVEDRAFT_v1g248668 [Nematostella vectensis]
MRVTQLEICRIACFLISLYATGGNTERFSSGDTLWPLPRELEASGGPLPLSLAFTIQTSSESEILARGITRYLEIITTHLHTAARSRVNGSKELEVLRISVKSDDESLNEGTSYEYSLSFDSGPQATLTALTPYGALYGMETFSQLVVDGSLVYTSVSISDKPSFVHRGLMLDTGRRFFPMDLLYNTLDAMSYVKLNVLHFHLSDLCRFSVESKLFPDLRNNESEIYTQDDVRNLVAYARDRGIRVMPEVEGAAHANGLLGLKNKGLQFCNHSGYTQLYNDPQGNTLKTMKAILSEMVPLFPEQIFHLGLDEVFTDKNCTLQSLQSFELALQEHLLQLGKIPAAWEEALSSTKSVTNRTVIQAWKAEGIKTIVDLKQFAINSLSSHFYLNYMGVTPLQLWTDIAVGLNETEVQYLLGGEMAMWTDNYCYILECAYPLSAKPSAYWMYDPLHDGTFTQSVAGIIWPRAVVGAGSFWNYNSDLSADSAEFNMRYQGQHKRLIERGIISCPVGCSCDELTRCGKPYFK